VTRSPCRPDSGAAGRFPPPDSRLQGTPLTGRDCDRRHPRPRNGFCTSGPKGSGGVQTQYALHGNAARVGTSSGSRASCAHGTRPSCVSASYSAATSSRSSEQWVTPPCRLPYLSTHCCPSRAASAGVSQDHSAPRARRATQTVSPWTIRSSTEYELVASDIRVVPRVRS
jgi:hypothetical protein